MNNETSYGINAIGRESPFNYNGSVFTFGGIRSSRVKSITFNDSTEMLVQTKNTLYTFEKVTDDN